MAKMIGNSNLRGCGNDFADLKKPGCRVNRIHLWAEFRSQDNSSNLGQRFWPVSMDPGRVLHKFGRERALATLAVHRRLRGPSMPVLAVLLNGR